MLDPDDNFGYSLQSHEQLWLEVAEKVTMTVQQIIEFAKMIPGFMNLLQDDQIMLLKGGKRSAQAFLFTNRLYTVLIFQQFD